MRWHSAGGATLASILCSGAPEKYYNSPLQCAGDALASGFDPNLTASLCSTPPTDAYHAPIDCALEAIAEGWTPNDAVTLCSSTDSYAPLTCAYAAMGLGWDRPTRLSSATRQARMPSISRSSAASSRAQ